MDFSEILIKHEEEIKKAIKKEYIHMDRQFIFTTMTK